MPGKIARHFFNQKLILPIKLIKNNSNKKVAVNKTYKEIPIMQRHQLPKEA